MGTTIRRLLGGATCVALVLAAGCGGDDDEGAAATTTARGSGLDGTITVFAPTNDALAAVDPSVLDQLRSDPELLQWYLSYTVVQGDIPLESLATMTAIQSLLGEFIPITVVDGVVQVDGVATIPPRIDALNGGIIPVAGVLIPEATPG